MIQAPDKIPITVFLAGTIDNGAASEWQKEVVEAYSTRDDLFFFNPRRENWDPDASGVQQQIQIRWEMKAMEKADIIFMYFEPESLSPITLLELGCFKDTGKLIVCCPEGFWRKSNVDYICARSPILALDDFDKAVKLINTKATGMV